MKSTRHMLEDFLGMRHLGMNDANADLTPYAPVIPGRTVAVLAVVSWTRQVRSRTVGELFSSKTGAPVNRAIRLNKGRTFNRRTAC
jgi:hypothetical protein